MQLRFEIVPKQSIRNSWDVWRKYLNEISQKMKDSWTPEDFFPAFMGNTAFLFSITDETLHSFGITVVIIKIRQYTGEPYLEVFAANLDSWDEVTGPQMIAFYDDIAKKAGCSKIEFSSSRLGWLKKNTGCKVARVVYQREVPNG